jgi:acetyl esterase/lipase
VVVRLAPVGILFALALHAAPASAQQVVPLWPGPAPGSAAWQGAEIDYSRASPNPAAPGAVTAVVRNVVQPTVTVFRPRPDLANGTAVIISPGGGFRFLWWQDQGTDIARWLNSRGVTAFVLKYRLVPTPASPALYDQQMKQTGARIAAAEKTPGNRRQDFKEVLAFLGDSGDWTVDMAWADARQAVRVVRQHASDWGVAPDRIGVMGFTSGAFVSMGPVMDHDAASRPDFAALIYGGETFGKPVPADAPPLFILAAQDNIEAGITQGLYNQWTAAGKSAEFHVFAKGGKGLGLFERGLPIDHWPDLLTSWMAGQGLLKAKR